MNLYSPFNMVETTTKKTQKHSQQTITHYDSYITCPEISSDDEQAGHSANQSKTLPDIENNLQYITSSKQFHEESIYNKVERP